jgi:hypothetical protein
MPERTSDDVAAHAMQISRLIKPYLVGTGTETQSAVLANLTALWLASHIGPNAEATAEYRRGLLDGHVELIRRLIEPSEQEILDGLIDRKHPQ